MKNILIIVIILSATFIIKSFAQTSGWEVVQSNTTENLNSIYFFDHQRGFAVGNSGVVIKSVDSGKTWQSLQSPLSFNLNDCFMFSEDCYTAVGDSASWIGTNDGGNTWLFDQVLELVNEIYSFSFYPRAQFFVYDGIYGADSKTILEGTHAYCSDVINDDDTSGSGGFWGTFMLTEKIGFVAGENSISQPIVGRTSTGGSAWDYVSFYLDGKEGRATGVAFTDILNGFISAIVWEGGGAISKTIDNGDTWTTKFFGHSLHGISFPISGTSQIGYCVGDSGTILKTYNAGDNWYYQISPASERLNKVFFIDQNFGFAVGENGTILRTTNGGGSTTHLEDEVTSLYNFELQQNYPNPFNPSTKISFVIDHSSFVSLKVYDILGNEVATLVNEEKPSGVYEVEFNANKLSSGIYFYQLTAGNPSTSSGQVFSQTRKMMLMK